MKRALFSVLVYATILSAQPENGNFVAYYTSWSIYARDYHVMDIPADKLTHINYAFANISGGEIALGDPYADIDRFYEGDSWDADSLRGNFHQLQILKEAYPHLRTMISVGGWTWSVNFSDIALTEESRSIFAQSCVEFIDEYGFDGIDLDWEYPVEGGGPGMVHRPEDRENYTLLCAAIRERLDSLSDLTGREYLLSIAAPASVLKTENFQLPELAEILDFINVMAYDYHGPFGGEADGVTNFNAALYMDSRSTTPEPYRTYFNVAATVDSFVGAGFPREKLNVGLAFYGRGYAGATAGLDGLFSGFAGAASPGTWEAGVFDYTDLDENYIGVDGFTRYWSEEAKVPWLYNPDSDVFISYDDTMSIGYKARFIQDMGLGGAMCWELSGDRDQKLIDAVVNAFSTSFDIDEKIPASESIQIYPNPFNSSCRLQGASNARIYDLRGRCIDSIENGIWRPGDDVPTGLYLCSALYPDGRRVIANLLYLK